MPLPLPDDWIDTGVTHTVSSSGSMRVRTRANSGPGYTAGLGSWTLQVTADSVEDPDHPGMYMGFLKAWVIDTYTNSTMVLNDPFLVSDYNATFWTPDWYAYSGSIGPYRLGVRVKLIPSVTPYPVFAQRDYELEYAWFEDEHTKWIETLAGHTTTQYANGGGWSPTPDVGLTPYPVGGSIGGFAFGNDVDLGGAAEFKDLTCEGDLDTTGLADGNLVGDGGGAAHTTGAGSGNGYVSAPWSWDEDIDVSRFGGSSTGATIVDLDGATHALPYQGSKAMRETSWTGPLPYSSAREFSIDSTWAAAQPVPFRSDDLQIPLMQSPKARNGATYTPIQITIPFEIDLLRPDGAITTKFVSPNDKIAVSDPVSEDPGDQHRVRFDVTATDGSVSRTLQSNWKKRVGLGPLGTLDPDFNIIAYQHTKHFSGEDIYAWDIFSQMELDITAPSATTLTVQIDGNYLEVYDPHTTSHRVDDYTATLHAFSYQYTVHTRSGQGTYYVDLCFPNGVIGPVYPSRIDKITLSGFNTGEYYLNEWELEARGYAYLKIDFGPPVQRGDYSAIMLSLNGSFGLGNLPDQTNKPDETGQYGGGIRYVEITTGYPSGDIQDQQYNPSAMAGYLDAIEGISATYSQGAEDAFLKDAYDKTLGPGLAQWIRPVVPYRGLVPTVPFAPPCSVQCRRVRITNAASYTIYSRWNAGYGAIEALVANDEGGRAPGGITLTAGYGSEGVTDPWGYVVVTPVPANGALTYTLQGG